MTASILSDIAPHSHIAATAPISIPTAMARLMSTARSSSPRDRLLPIISPLRLNSIETPNSRLAEMRNRKPFQSSARKRSHSIQLLARSLLQDASSRPPNSQARVRLPIELKTRQAQTVFFPRWQSAASHRAAPPCPKLFGAAQACCPTSSVSTCTRRGD